MAAPEPPQPLLPTPDHAAAVQRLWGLLVAFGEHLGAERQFSAHTVRAYCADMRAVIGRAVATGLWEPDSWTTAILTETLALGRNRGGTAAACGRTVARKHSALRAFFLWHHRDRDADADPTDALIGPETVRKLPRPVALDPTLRMLLPQEDDSLVDVQAAAAMMLLYGLGLLLGEAERLAREEVNLAAGWVEVEGSGKRRRRVPVPSLCRAPLARWQALRPFPDSPFFLTGRGGGPLSRRTIARRVAALAASRLGRHVSPQQMRHSFATHLLDGGARLREVQTLLGHASLSSTQTYSAVTLAHLREAHARAHPRGREPPPARPA